MMSGPIIKPQDEVAYMYRCHLAHGSMTYQIFSTVLEQNACSERRISTYAMWEQEQPPDLRA